MFMTQFRLPPKRYSHVHVHNAAVSASLLVLLTVTAGCGGGSETARAPAADPRKRPAPEPEDAGMQCTAFNADYRSEFKACASDDDCEVVAVQYGCLEQRGVYAVAKADREEFDRCLPNVERLKSCMFKPDPVRAENGRVVSEDLHDVHARCVAGSCTARVEERACGSAELECTGAQLCVSYEDKLGVTQFRCVDNQCGDAKLDCECAKPVCDMIGDTMRACAVEQIVASDVYCKPILR
jgi:hypothetical protein